MANRDDLNNISGKISGILVIAGAVVALIAFYLFVPPHLRNTARWIALASVVIGFSLSVFILQRTFSDAKQNGKVLPALLLDSVAIGIYDVFVIVMLFFAGNIENRIFFAVHLIAFFVLAVLLAVTFITTLHAKVVNDEQAEASEGIVGIKTKMDALSYKFNRLPEDYSAQKSRFSELHENAGYISPNSGQQAGAIESEIATLLNKLSSVVSELSEGNASDAKELGRLLTDLSDQLDMRKKIRS